QAGAPPRLPEMPSPLTRRQCLSWLALSSLGIGSVARAATQPESSKDAAPPDELEMKELDLGGTSRAPHRARVFVPKVRRADERFPLLVLLHGLAETESEALGVRAWGDRYGLLSADRRLRHPPVVRERPGRYLPEERLARINA